MDSFTIFCDSPKLAILIEAYRDHEGALRASMREVYGVTDLRAEGFVRLADLVRWLPRGCALWRSMGGDLSLTEDAHVLRLVEYQLRVLVWQQTQDGQKGRNQPKPPTAVPWAQERKAEASHSSRQLAARERRERLSGR